ncbi:MAG: NADH-quinone oxidoreductase subunit C [Gammaproteobacteria bacterium]
MNELIATLLNVPPKYWSASISGLTLQKSRFVALWGQDLDKELSLTACFELKGKHFLLRTKVSSNEPILPSITPFYPAANRLERHASDMFGFIFSDHPDQRRWTRHAAWGKKEFPLRKSFPAVLPHEKTTPGDSNYPFVQATGSGVYEIPVGPVHAGIIEPGHFRFEVAGEDVISLEERLGYVHKGIEKIAEGRNPESLVKLSNRISGDSPVAYSWATCQAIENAYKIKVPKRALFLRAIMLERERVANHLGDFAAICNDVGFAFAYYQLMRLKEIWLRKNMEFFGHRLLMDLIKVGGVKVDLDTQSIEELKKQCLVLKKELKELYPMLEENSSLHDRLKTTGVLSPEKASALGVLGYVGKASGCKFDLRRDVPCFPYDQYEVRIPVYNTGDVLSRLRVRAQEILISLELLSKFMTDLPDGSICELIENKPKKAVEGIGLIEGWRGEVLVYVNFTKDGVVDRYFPRDPSWFSWPALEELIHGNIVPDFPVCNKSVNGSYSGVDL